MTRPQPCPLCRAPLIPYETPAQLVEAERLIDGLIRVNSKVARGWGTVPNGAEQVKAARTALLDLVEALTRPQPSTSSVEAVARAIYESLDLSFELKDDMARDGEFAKAAEAVVAALSPEREPMREALEECRETLALINRRFENDFGKRSTEVDKAVALADAALAPPPAQSGDRT